MPEGTAPHPTLNGRARWVTAPSTVAVAAAVVLAVAYAWASLSFPEGTRTSFLLVLAVVSLSAQLIGDRVEQSRLTTLDALGRGVLPPTEDNLLAAAREVARITDVSFLVVLSLMAGGALASGAVWGLINDVPAAVVVRVFFVGVLPGPIGAVMAALAERPRVRVVLSLLVDAGLPLARLYDELPRAFQMRQRLVAFFLVVTVSPALLTADLLLLEVSRLVDRVALAPAELTGALLADGPGGGWVPVAIVGGVVALMALTSASLSGSEVAIPLRHLEAETERLARGTGGAPRFVPAEYEAFATAGTLLAMERAVEASLDSLSGAADGIGTATRTLGEGSGEALLARPALSRAAVEAASQTAQDLARAAKEIAHSADEVSALAGQTLAAATAGEASAAEFARAMVEVKLSNQAIADAVVRLSGRVQQVGRIVDFIDGVADRSDLLAVNAELEGTKAGDPGRGFSLVAAEMRRLAESVFTSTQEIGRRIEDIRDATNAAVMATEAGVKATEVGLTLAARVRERLAAIVVHARGSDEAQRTIRAATARQEAGAEELVGAMGDILAATLASEAATRDMTRAHAGLTALAEELRGSLARGGRRGG